LFEKHLFLLTLLKLVTDERVVSSAWAFESWDWNWRLEWWWVVKAEVDPRSFLQYKQRVGRRK